MGTLYECLKEARLDKYYPSFRAQGITKSESLVRLTVHDCAALGINSAEDKRRLVELINIVKAVHHAERDNYLASGNTRQSQNAKNKPARKRNRSPAPTSTQAARSALSQVSDIRVMDRSRTSVSSQHLGGAIYLSDDDSEESSSDDSDEHSDYEPAVKHSVTSSVAREVPLRIRKTPVEKVKHGTGYNYGVPGSSPSTGAKPKVRQSVRHNDEKIKVCVRKRPLSKREVKSGEVDMINAASTTTLVVSEPKQAVDLTAFTLQHEFMFDEVFEETCTNEDVYIRAARPLINCIFDGGSATCFAYGQTGAGKTHTMIGNSQVPGLYLLAAHDIFSIIDSGQYGHSIKVWVSFFEIYCGQLFDLLNKRNRLHAREDGSQRVCIAGLTETEATDEQSLMQVLEYGNSVRSKGATGVNPDSSRSHAVLQMEIRDRQDKRLGRISFIDLAGSERAADSADTDRQTRMEGAEINQSLLALKECIRSIDQESRHKPFRQSKLTHILKDSFIGNSRTCMIANISPASSSCEHTLNTLRYADRVKELRRNVGTSSSVSRSTNVAMSNILMNIPASAPSLFQPSNILCSSTPMRQGSRQFTNRSSPADIHLDPSETPIKGHGVRRKTSSAVSRSESKQSQQSSRTNSSVNTSSSRASYSSAPQSKASVVRHVAPSNIPAGAGTRQNVSSNSESDQTDTDSNNVTGPQKPLLNAYTAQNGNFRAVDRRTIPDSRTNVSSQNIPVVKSTDTENDFPTTDFNNEEVLNDLNRTGGKNNVAASVPVFPLGGGSNDTDKHLGDYGDSPYLTAQRGDNQSRFPSVSASVPVLQKKIYTDSKPESKQNSDNSKLNSNDLGIYQADSQKQDVFKGSSAQNVVLSTASGSLSTKANDTVTGTQPAVVKDPKESPKSKTVRPKLKMPSTLTDSFEDDLLFDPPSMDQRMWTPRTPSENSGTQPRTPQDPSVQPEIPAVLPAKSTELTTFSQRSPRWQLNKKQHNIPAPAPQPGFRPEPIRNIPGEYEDKGKKEQSVSSHSPHGANPKMANQVGKNPSMKAKDIYSEGNGMNMPSNISKKNEISSDYQTNSNRQRVPMSVSDRNNSNQLMRIGEQNSTPKVNDRDEQKEPSSANWFTTPVDFDTHIAQSVSKGNKLLPAGNSNCEKKEKTHDTSQTEYMGYPEGYRPIQRHGDKNRSAHSDSGIVSATSGSVTPNESRSTQQGLNKYSSKGEDSSTNSNYHKSELSQPGYFSDSVTNRPKTNSINPSSNVRQKVVHSPVNTGRDGNSSPVIREYNSFSPMTLSGRSGNSGSPYGNKGGNSESPVNGKSASNAFVTEKLQAGSTFSPIHPEPLTSMRQSKNAMAVSKDILHPTPVSKVSSSSDGGSTPRADVSSGEELVDLKSQLITSHEDQLATVTSLCKQEMKLLLGAKAGNKSFGEYMKRVSDVLAQKMSAIQLLQDQIIAYQLSTQESVE